MKFGQCLTNGTGPKPCQYKHDGQSKGPNDAGKKQMLEMKAKDCPDWMKGTCSRAGKCFYQHVPAKKGTTNRSVAVADDAPAESAAAPAEAPVLQ